MVRIYHEIREITRRGPLKQNRTCLMTYLALSVFKTSSVSCTRQNKLSAPLIKCSALSFSLANLHFLDISSRERMVTQQQAQLCKTSISTRKTLLCQLKKLRVCSISETLILLGAVRFSNLIKKSSGSSCSREQCLFRQLNLLMHAFCRLTGNLWQFDY